MTATAQKNTVSHKNRPYEWCSELLKGSHVMIGGCSGSGKSVAENDLIYTLMANSPNVNLFMMIDLKKVELAQWKKAPHVLRYVDLPEDVEHNLKCVCNLIDRRLERMQEKGERKSSEPFLWVVIDEYADLVLTCPKAVQKYINRIALVGRAANVKLLILTQRPTREIISGPLAAVLECKLCLRTVTAQESRNMIQTNGAEQLPDYGYGIMQVKGRNKQIEIPLTSDEEIESRVAYWEEWAKENA